MKAGVIMKELSSEKSLQLHLFSKESSKETTKQIHLMKAIDDLNKRYGRNTVQWAACGVHKEWEMRRRYLSVSATTLFDQIPIVTA